MIGVVEAFKYPFSNIKRLIISAVINAFWFILIPIFFVNGYVVKIIRTTLQGENELPEWSNIKYILTHGFFLSVVVMAYFFIPIILSYAGFSFMDSTSPVEISSVGEIPAIPGVATVFFILSIITLIGAAVILPMAIIVYSASENIKTAFNIPLILEKIMIDPISYARSLVYSFFVFFGFTFLIPFLTVFSGLVMIYPLFFSARVWAQAMKGKI